MHKRHILIKIYDFQNEGIYLTMKSTFMMKKRIEKIMMRFIFPIWTTYKKLFLIRKGNKACLHPAWVECESALPWLYDYELVLSSNSLQSLWHVYAFHSKIPNSLTKYNLMNLKSEHSFKTARTRMKIENDNDEKACLINQESKISVNVGCTTFEATT